MREGVRAAVLTSRGDFRLRGGGRRSAEGGRGFRCLSRGGSGEAVGMRGLSRGTRVSELGSKGGCSSCGRARRAEGEWGIERVCKLR
ncbi:hypothetical protein CRG98_011308 [Punica granatum]|uniref:Uncharacterized protein n=1 Tax=Punica granatum TaxID=22663 RepID=A0A2I0KJD8_PUNGR|nr:hypothetical protein CRG98_011308 [Punica granatum]